jgi:thiol-disulfide isomerase/thioredoxin
MSTLLRSSLFSLSLAVLFFATACGIADDESPAADEAAATEPEVEVEPEIIPLGIGDPAPAIAIQEWVTGEAVEGFEEGQVYVVEFWATWCGPCLASMPHIAQLQTEYGDDIQFIGVTREDIDVVTGFLDGEQSEGKTWRDVITYRLAIDADDATNNAYMLAAGQNGIPTAFIVGRDGVVEWIGHPMSIDEPLASVTGDTWDRAAAIAEFQKQQRVQEAMTELSALFRALKYDDALALLDSLEAEVGGSTQTSRIRLVILQRAGRTEEANALQAKLVEDAWEDAQALNEISWGIATSGGGGDLDLAFRAAMRASELTNHEDASILDTVARIYYEQGNLELAIEWQQKAVAQNAALQPTLDQFLAAQAAAVAAESEATTPAGDGEETEGETENP